MKKQLLMLSQLLLLCCAATAFGQGMISATFAGTAVSGSYTAEEAFADVSVAVCSQNGTTRYVLPDAAKLGPLAAGEECTFSVDLSVYGGTVTVSDTSVQTTQIHQGLTQAQREHFLAGRLYVQAYQGAYKPSATPLAETEATAGATAMSVFSAGITGDVIDDAYGKKGKQKQKGIPTLSIPLSIRNLPEGTAALAVSMVDPDGGDWVHWLAANLPVTEEIPANASIDWAAQMLQGVNDFGQTGYGGPTPPSGTHTYVITVFALAQPLKLEAGFTMKAFHTALEGAVLAEAELTGDYRR